LGGRVKRKGKGEGRVEEKKGGEGIPHQLWFVLFLIFIFLHEFNSEM